MADGDNSGKGGETTVPLILGSISVVMVIALGIFTEFIFDCSVILDKKLWIPLIVVCLIPFIFVFVKLGKKIGMIGAGIGFVVTLVLVFLLIYRRNKVTRLWITDKDINSLGTPEQTKKLMSYLSPSGVLVLAGPGSVGISAQIANMEPKGDPVKKALAERLSKAMDKANKAAAAKSDPKNASADPNASGSASGSESGSGSTATPAKKPEATSADYDTYIADPKVLDMLKGARLSGVQWQMLINLSADTNVASLLSDEKDRKKYGFVDFK